MYIAQGMSQLYKLALEWAEVLDVQCYMTINPNDLVSQLEPIYQVTQTVHSFAVRVEEAKTQQLRTVNVNKLIELMSSILQGIQ